jgi:hypothetical protein
MRKLTLVAGIALIMAAGVYLYLSWTPKKCRVGGIIKRDGKPLEWKEEMVPPPAVAARTVGLLGSAHGEGPFLAAAASLRNRPILLQVIFMPVNRGHNDLGYRCEGDVATGAYELIDVPAGTYRVSIQQQDPYPTHDLLQFKFDLKNSPIVKEVTQDRQELNIDLPKELPR